MNRLREAAQQALEALLDDCLVQVGPHSWERRSDLAITALRAALAEPVQESAPMPPFPPVSQWKQGCAVCGIGADGKAKVYGYVCPRSDCPTRVTCGGAV